MVFFPLRILWLLIVLLMLAGLIAVLVESVIKFQARGTTTAFSLKLAKKLPFPAISVCNNLRVSVIAACEMMI